MEYNPVMREINVILESDYLDLRYVARKDLICYLSLNEAIDIVDNINRNRDIEYRFDVDESDKAESTL
jgi:hypothetical protein